MSTPVVVNKGSLASPSPLSASCDLCCCKNNIRLHSVGSFSFRDLQWHQRGLLVMKIRNLMKVQVLVNHNTPLVDSQESHQEKSYKDIFTDGDWSSGDLPPPPHPSPLLF
ncbi:hypothetical protein E2C01_044457 [Portunus trituberculatus]|uniref:Uncharacterized protein n=1 Tax=Portunus trituberculatus TaxID=210409 RepID=A0A5B7G0I6_PORTR|nr:hypothetical protein [Portunus trituberculatus]